MEKRKSNSTKAKIDRRLEKIAHLEAYLIYKPKSEEEKRENESVKKKIQKCYREIQQLDKSFYSQVRLSY